MKLVREIQRDSRSCTGKWLSWSDGGPGYVILEWTSHPGRMTEGFSGRTSCPGPVPYSSLFPRVSQRISLSPRRTFHHHRGLHRALCERIENVVVPPRPRKDPPRIPDPLASRLLPARLRYTMRTVPSLAKGGCLWNVAGSSPWLQAIEEARIALPLNPLAVCGRAALLQL